LKRADLRLIGGLAGVGLACAALIGCPSRQTRQAVSIEFTKVPPADRGGPDTRDEVAGQVVGARPGQRIVLFAKSGGWWVQPELRDPYTAVEADSSFRNFTHLGTEYAAALVEPGYSPPPRADSLPVAGGPVVAVAVVAGRTPTGPVHKTLSFGGYDWIVRNAPSDRGGRNEYDPANAWTDDEGALHLRIARAASDWTCAEVSLARRLGYGTYAFVVRDVSRLEPAAVFSIFTWDGPAAEQNHREVDLEFSRWGDPAAKNAQYAVQPYYEAGNVARFAAPAGLLTHSLRWEPGRAAFRTVHGASAAAGAPAVFAHAFTSGVPSSGDERVRLNLYVFRRSAQALERGAEIVVQKFEYVP
jgi:hypothetical protein